MIGAHVNVGFGNPPSPLWRPKFIKDTNRVPNIIYWSAVTAWIHREDHKCRLCPGPTRSSPHDCAICLSEASFAAQTNCSHIYCANCLLEVRPRRILRSSRPQDIFQPSLQGFFSVHGQLQLLGNIFQLSVLCTAVNVQNKN
jgi:hypothetical protein